MCENVDTPPSGTPHWRGQESASLKVRFLVSTTSISSRFQDEVLNDRQTEVPFNWRDLKLKELTFFLREFTINELRMRSEKIIMTYTL